jgi:hypothetical protein
MLAIDASSEILFYLFFKNSALHILINKLLLLLLLLKHNSRPDRQAVGTPSQAQ